MTLPGAVKGSSSICLTLTTLLSLILAAPELVAQSRAESLTLLSSGEPRILQTTRINGHEVVALDHLAKLFRLTINEDPLTGGLTVSYQDQDIVLTLEQSLVSVVGRLVSLPSSPVRTDQGWLVPVEFIGRALTFIYDKPIEFRQRSRLVIIGDLRVPRVTVRHQRVGQEARVSLEMTPASDYQIIHEQDRILVQFDVDALDPTLPGLVSGQLVSAIRLSKLQTSVVIDLGPNFGSFNASTRPAPGGIVDLIVTIAPRNVEIAAVETPSSIPSEPPPPLSDLVSPQDIKTIVIDPGHGGEEHGAHGPEGALEKDITLGVARRLKGAIEQQLGIRVVLTRTADQTVRLDERAAIANNNKADLFISLHVNSSTRSSVVGAEIFFLSIDDYGDEAVQIATSDRQAVPVVGGGLRNIEVTLWEMAQVPYLEQSAVFAEVVEDELRGRLSMSPRAIQQAPFRVLVGANMPAVLLEMGFISNPVQEQQLTSGKFQQTIVNALVGSIIRFRDYLQHVNETDIAAVETIPTGGRPQIEEAR